MTKTYLTIHGPAASACGRAGFFAGSRMSVALGIVALLALTACSSPAPARYYTLLDAAATASVATNASGPTGASASASANTTPFALQVTPVRVPAAVDLPQVLVRSSEGEVVPLENARWLGPIADEIRGALVSQLTQSLRVPEVSAVSTPPGMPIYRLQVAVTRFDSVRGRYALQDVDWSLREVPASGVSIGGTGAAPAVLLCSSRQVVTPSDDSTGALVRAHQSALAALGRQIATVAATPGGQWRCP